LGRVVALREEARQYPNAPHLLHWRQRHCFHEEYGTSNSPIQPWLDAVERILEKDPEAATYARGNALRFAIEAGDLSSFHFLVTTCGLDPKAKEALHSGMTPLHFAARRGETQIVKFLVESCDMNPLELTTKGSRTSEYTILRLATLSNNEECIRYCHAAMEKAKTIAPTPSAPNAAATNAGAPVPSAPSAENIPQQDLQDEDLARISANRAGLFHLRPNISPVNPAYLQAPRPGGQSDEK
jgi:hypothetical protein